MRFYIFVTYECVLYLYASMRLPIVESTRNAIDKKRAGIYLINSKFLFKKRVGIFFLVFKKLLIKENEFLFLLFCQMFGESYNKFLTNIFLKEKFAEICREQIPSLLPHPIDYLNFSPS